MKTEYTTHGIKGNGSIVSLPTGERLATVSFNNGKFIKISSHLVDIQEIKCDSLQEALNKACHSLGYLPILKLEVIKGKEALVSWYKKENKPNEGYATIVKKGVKPLRFDVKRINKEEMKVNTIEEALRKVAFETGKIKLK